jgi:hypothetical protein
VTRTVFIFNEPFVIITDKEYIDYIVYKFGENSEVEKGGE